MPYKVLPKSQAVDYDRSGAIAGIEKMRKHGIARLQPRPQVYVSKAQRAANEQTQLCYALSILDFNRSLYAFARSKIENPAIPTGEKRAWRKTALALESFFGRETLQDSPYCPRARATRALRQSYQFCYVKPRVQ